MQFVIKRLISSKPFRQAFTLGAGTAVGQLFVVVASPIWSRLYSPTDFGRYGLMLSFLSTVIVAGSLRFDLSIPLGRDDEESLLLLLLSLVCTVPVSIIASVVLFWLTTHNLLGFGALSPWSVILVVLLLLLTCIFTALRYWHIRSSGFREIGSSLVAQGVGRALTPILVSPLGFGWLGLLSGEVLGRSLGIGKLGKEALPLLISMARTTPISKLFTLMRTYKQYPLVFLPSAVLDAAAGAIEVPVFIGLYGIAAGGQFLLAKQVVMAPAAFIGASLGDVLHSRLLSARADKAAELPRLVVRTTLRLLLVMSVIYIPVAILAPYISVPIFGHSWVRVGTFVAILTPATIIAGAVSPVSRAMVLSRIPQVKFVVDFAKLVLPVTGMIVAGRLSGGSINVGIASLSAMTVLCYVLYFCVILFSVQARYQLASQTSPS
jgi:O-antigen/teichoic acid export membrane protein